MAQVNGIIITIRSEQAEEFERLFAAEESPVWRRLAEGEGQLQLSSKVSDTACAIDRTPRASIDGGL